MSAGFFSDLDNTLIFSARRVGATPQVATQVEQHRDGTGGFISNRTLEMLAEVSRKFTFVPVTTRNQEQYQRLMFPGVKAEWAIVANGAVVLHRGERDEAWIRHLESNVLPNTAPIRQVTADLSDLLEGAGLEYKRRIVEDLFVYDYIYEPERLPEVMDRVHELASGSNWKVSLQGHKLYLIPTGLTKGAAARELANRLNLDSFLAAGDSLLDVSLLDEADVAWGLPGELDEANPYPYRRITQKHFKASDLLMQQVLSELR